MSETLALHYTLSQRIWLITGGSSGIGLEVTKQVLQNDGIAAVIHRPSPGNFLPPTLSSLQSSLPLSRASNLLLLPCDITSPSQISAAFVTTHSRFGRIDVVLNNAGCTILGEIEGTPEDKARKMFDVNFWGMCNVSREAVKAFREVNVTKRAGGKIGGTLLNVSSGAGVVPNAGIGYYSASGLDTVDIIDSKHALEGFTDALAKELDPAWNIQITILEPGAFRTRAHTDNTTTLPVHPAYTSTTSLASHQTRRWFAGRSGITGDPALAAERIYKFVMGDPLDGNLDGSTDKDVEIEAPLRLQLGDDSWDGIKIMLEKRLKEMERVEKWSRGLASR